MTMEKEWLVWIIIFFFFFCFRSSSSIFPLSFSMYFCVSCVCSVCFLQVSFDEDVVLWQFPCWQLEMHYTNQQCLKLQKKETKDWKDSNKYCGILVIEQIQHDKLNPPINWHQTLSSHFESPK